MSHAIVETHCRGVPDETTCLQFFFSVSQRFNVNLQLSNVYGNKLNSCLSWVAAFLVRNQCLWYVSIK